MTTHKPEQLTHADVQRLFKQRKHADIEAAKAAGQLDDMLGVQRHYPPVAAQWSLADVEAMYREGRTIEIDTARDAGLLQSLTDGDPVA